MIHKATYLLSANHTLSFVTGGKFKCSSRQFYILQCILLSPERGGCGYIGSTIYFDHYGSLYCPVDSTDTVDIDLSRLIRKTVGREILESNSETPRPGIDPWVRSQGHYTLGYRPALSVAIIIIIYKFLRPCSLLGPGALFRGMGWL